MEGSAASEPRPRLHAYGVTALVIVAIFSAPIRGVDDFPLSTYPMFSSRRPDWAWISRVEVESESGRRARVSPSLVTGGPEPMQAVATLNRALRNRQGASLCKQIAERVGNSGRFEQAREVVLERVEVSVLGYFDESAKPRQIEVKARCPVPSEAGR